MASNVVNGVVNKGTLVWLCLGLATAWSCSGSSSTSGLAPGGPTSEDDASADATMPHGVSQDGQDGGRSLVDANGDAANTMVASDGATNTGTEGGALGAGNDGGATLSTIHFLGRFDTREAAGPRFAWPGTAIAATFQGTGISVTLSDTGTNYFVVVIDGGAPTVLATSGNGVTYSLAANLPQGKHTLMLTKRTEALVGVVQFLGLTPQGGALVPSAPPFTRRIEYVGDSITCGYGDLGADQTCTFSAATEDETIAYGSLTAAALNAQQTVIAYSGKGMYREYGGSTTNQMPVLFDLVLPDDPTSTWGFTTPEPDVVVVNLSSNDFATGDPGAAFVDAYTTFLQTLRGHYPDAYVICTLAPTMLEPNRTIAAGYIGGVVKQARDAGDLRVSTLQIPADDGGTFFGFATQLASNGYGCDYHPSKTTQHLMGTQLTAAIPPIVGW